MKNENQRKEKRKKKEERRNNKYEKIEGKVLQNKNKNQ